MTEERLSPTLEPEPELTSDDPAELTGAGITEPLAGLDPPEFPARSGVDEALAAM